MAELADAADSKSAELRPLGVRLPLPAPIKSMVLRIMASLDAFFYAQTMPKLKSDRARRAYVPEVKQEQAIASQREIGPQQHQGAGDQSLMVCEEPFPLDARYGAARPTGTLAERGAAKNR